MAITPDTITLITSPPEDWMPVFQPILYVFQRAGDPLASFPTLVVKIEVSHNGTDFSAPLTAGIMSVPIGTGDRYTVNPAPYLASMFSISPPVAGTNASLSKFYRLKVGRSNIYNGAGTPEITTDSAYCAYAVKLPTIDFNDTILSSEPFDGYYDGFDGIITYINAPDNTIKNDIIEAPVVPAHACPKYPKHMYWLNRIGGWQAWVFNGNHEYEDDVSEGVLWQDSAGATHTASLGPVQHKCSVKSGFVSKSIYDTIAGIRHSIKVYHNDNGTWREVNIERGNYARYKEGDKRREVNFSFTYAEPLIIQQA